MVLTVSRRGRSQRRVYAIAISVPYRHFGDGPNRELRRSGFWHGVPVRLLPRSVVDRLPTDWWRPGNLVRFAGQELHFCDDDHVKTIEINGRIIAQGKKLFPYGHWD